MYTTITAADQLAADIARLDTLTPDQLLRETADAELLAATGEATPEDLAYRAELEKLAEGLAITPSQRDGWACINCGVTAGSDVPMEPVRNIKIGPGATWTLFAHPACRQPTRVATDAPVTAANIQAGDLVEATIASTKPRTIRVRVDRAPWPCNERSTVLSDGRGVDAVLTDSIRVIETSRRN